VEVLAAKELRKSYGSQEVGAGALLACAPAGFYAATVLFRRRLLK
jgi:hypothetical protein